MTLVRHGAGARPMGFKAEQGGTIDHKLTETNRTAETARARATQSLAGAGRPGSRTCFCTRSAHKLTATESGGSVQIACGPRSGRWTSVTSSASSSSQNTMSTQEHSTNPSPSLSNSPSNTQPSTQNFIFLNAVAKESVGGATAPPHRAVGTVSLAITQELATRVLGGGPRTPSPASHHLGVSGWVLDPRLTPDWCEASEGVVGDA